MNVEATIEVFREAINAVEGATPDRYALFVSPELYVTYDAYMQDRSGGTVAFPLMFGAYKVVENVEASMGTALLERRTEIRKAFRLR